jgi:serine/threonine-protein kinase
MTRASDAAIDLLFGMLALQIGLIEQGQLVAAFQAWARDRSRPLAEHLVARGDLDDEQRAVVEAMVALHLKKHGGDAERSLAAIPAGRSTRESLAGLGHPEVGSTLTQLGSGSDGDADRTASYAVGAATSEGQRFRVLRPHARGGLGAVFVALDEELHREVALKQILDQHADDRVSRTRFVLEAEITGGLEHPGIVPVYGLGTYGDGRPYYAMRFVRGDTLKEAIGQFHADATSKRDPGRRTLELRKLLRRFTDVCNAIDYAHSRGVLHRDIKPGNVIVGRHGESLVVDWGLAKATGRVEPGVDSGERTLVPSSCGDGAEPLPGSILGTPAYMSPEQARGDLEHLGPRSDVYSLGATLYCLLTGRPPRAGDSLGEQLRRAQRGEFSPPRQVDPSIDAALEAICLKAMAARPDDRYASPRLLADDIDRWTADEPVTAWREPFGRRARRWARRHRTGVAAAIAALVVALAGTLTVLAVQTRANQDLLAANSALDAANGRERARFALAMDAIRLFHGEVSEDLLMKEKLFDKLRTKLLRGAAGFYGKMEAMLRPQTDRTSRMALAKAYEELGELTAKIGSKPEALAVYRKALEVRRRLAAEPEADPKTVLDVARDLVAIGLVLKVTGRADETRAALDEARELAVGFRARVPASEDALALEGDSLGALGMLLLEMGKPAEALAAHNQAIAIGKQRDRARPGDVKIESNLATAHDNIAFVLTQTGKSDEALAEYKEALAIRQRRLRANPDHTQ